MSRKIQESCNYSKTSTIYFDNQAIEHADNSWNYRTDKATEMLAIGNHTNSIRDYEWGWKDFKFKRQILPKATNNLDEGVDIY